MNNAISTNNHTQRIQRSQLNLQLKKNNFFSRSHSDVSSSYLNELCSPAIKKVAAFILGNKWSRRNGSCTYLIRTIMISCKVSISTVKRAIWLLEEEGILLRETRMISYKHNLSNIYHIHPDYQKKIKYLIAFLRTASDIYNEKRVKKQALLSSTGILNPILINMKYNITKLRNINKTTLLHLLQLPMVNNLQIVREQKKDKKMSDLEFTPEQYSYFRQYPKSIFDKSLSIYHRKMANGGVFNGVSYFMATFRALAAKSKPNVNSQNIPSTGKQDGYEQADYSKHEQNQTQKKVYYNPSPMTDRDRNHSVSSNFDNSRDMELAVHTKPNMFNKIMAEAFWEKLTQDEKRVLMQSIHVDCNCRS